MMNVGQLIEALQEFGTWRPVVVEVSRGVGLPELLLPIGDVLRDQNEDAHVRVVVDGDVLVQVGS